MSRKRRKAKSDGTRSEKKAASMMERRLGTKEPVSKPPKGYRTWVKYFEANNAPPEPYRSWLEYRMFKEGALIGLPYECEVLNYTTEPKPHKYTPDGKFGKYHLELKGRFRTPEEAKKYIDIQRCNPKEPLVFIFAVRGVKMPGAKMRKCGTFRNMEEWAEENGFMYTFEAECKEFLRTLK